MQDKLHTTNWYMIDVTELYLVHCSTRGVELAATYLGSMVNLTDLCCHIALLTTKHIPVDIEGIITSYVLPNSLDVVSITLLTRVVSAFSSLLAKNFIHMALPDTQHKVIEHIQITDVKELIPTVPYGDVPKVASLGILASLSYTQHRSDYAREPINDWSGHLSHA